jgi:hypothetical protein
MRKRKINFRLLRKIQNHIMEEPRRVVMSRLALKEGEFTKFIEDAPKKFAPCGTAACIAGWALILSGEKPFTLNESGLGAESAQELLGLNGNEQTSLFHLWAWPETFSEKYHKAKFPKQRAKIVSDRIDYFIKHKK